MGQVEVIKLLEKSKKALSAKEITQILGLSRYSVDRSIKKLREEEEIYSIGNRKVSRGVHANLYIIKKYKK